MTVRRLALTLAAAAALAGAAAPAHAATPTCGTTILKSNGTPWQCTFADEFNGTSLDRSKWVPQQTALSSFTSGLTACFVDTPNNVQVSNGTLRLIARKEPNPFTCTDPVGNFRTQWTSGMVSTWNLFSQAYGRFEVRAKVPATNIPGLQESFWLWPQNPTKYGAAWPSSGEIDIAEMYSRYNDRAIPYIHYNPASYDPNVTNTNCLVSDLGAFHSYAVEWTPQTIKIVYDGKTCLTDSWNPAGLVKPQPFDQPYIVALTQALGITGNDFSPSTTPLPATTTVDYVHVWK